jgi:hypothetical protein
VTINEYSNYQYPPVFKYELLNLVGFSFELKLENGEIIGEHLHKTLNNL